MTKEDLINNNIYVPEVIDEQIKVRFLLGDFVLIGRPEHHFPYVVLRLDSNPIFKNSWKNQRFRLLKRQEISNLKRSEYKIKALRNIRVIYYRSTVASITWCVHPEDIDNIIKSLYD